MPCGQLTGSAGMAFQNRRARQVRDSGNESGSTFLIEANTATTGIINGMMRMYLPDEIILCTIPVIAGNGCRLFQGHLPGSEWTRDEIKAYKNGSLKAVYRKRDGASVQKMNTSLLKKVFRF